MKLHQSILPLLALTFLGACSPHTQLTVINKSQATLTNVVASGSGFSHALNPIAPGARQRITVGPTGESGLKLVFDAGGRHFEQPEQGYFEDGYKVTATVAPDFKVTVEEQSTPY